LRSSNHNRSSKTSFGRRISFIITSSRSET
jgi:hypothetical protein